jgi:acetyltransferase-like isoleucine patch superfamily enzyme
VAGVFYRKWLEWLGVSLALSAKLPAGVTIGCHTYGCTETTFYTPVGDEKVTIGKYCSIAAGVQFVFGDHGLTRVSTFPFRERLLHTATNTDAVNRGAIVVGNDVWLGHRSLIMANVRIGDGAVVAAGAVVTQDVDPYTIVGGVPARALKRRFSDSQIAELLKIRWWDWPQDYVIRNLDLFYEDVDAFIAAAHRENQTSGSSSHSVT